MQCHTTEEKRAKLDFFKLKVLYIKGHYHKSEKATHMRENIRKLCI